MSKLIAGVLGVLLPCRRAWPRKPRPCRAGTPVTITVKPAAGAAAGGVDHPGQPARPRRRPIAGGFTHTGGGNIDVPSRRADTVVITMTGVAVAGGHPPRTRSPACTST